MKTIVAISTPIGKGGIGIVRLSGNDSLAIADKVFTAESFSISTVKPNYMYFGYFSGAEFSDKGYMVYFKAPKSFTGEDTVEFQLHGGIRLLDGVVAECVKYGAVPAERGEFTKRAFLNGKLKLSDAEGVIDMINADSAAALRAGFRQMQGYLANDVGTLEKELINLIAALEASLDYPEETEDEVLPEIPKIKNANTIVFLYFLQKNKCPYPMADMGTFVCFSLKNGQTGPIAVRSRSVTAPSKIRVAWPWRVSSPAADKVQGTSPPMDRSMSKINLTSGSWGAPWAVFFKRPGPAWILARQLESSCSSRSLAQFRKFSSMASGWHRGPT